MHCLTLCLVGLVAAPPTPTAPADDLARLQGTWTAISVEMSGDKMSAEDAGQIRFTITKNEYTVHDGSRVVERGTLTVDRTTRPRTLDAHPSDGDYAGKVVPAIYGLMGDTLQICIGAPGKERPKAFAAPRGSGLRLFTLRQSPTPAGKRK